MAVPPNNNYTVSVFNYTAKQFLPANASMLCDAENATHENCWLHVKQQVHGHSLGFIMVKKNNTGTVRQSQRKLKAENITIENDVQKLVYKGYGKEGAEFNLIKKGYSQSYSFGFDIRHYPAYQGFNGTRGGASVFRPAISESLNYCALSANSTKYFMEGEAASQLTLEYDCPENTKAMVKVRLYANDPVIEWDVKTD